MIKMNSFFKNMRNISSIPKHLYWKFPDFEPKKTTFGALFNKFPETEDSTDLMFIVNEALSNENYELIGRWNLWKGVFFPELLGFRCKNCYTIFEGPPLFEIIKYDSRGQIDYVEEAMIPYKISCPGCKQVFEKVE